VLISFRQIYRPAFLAIGAYVVLVLGIYREILIQGRYWLDFDTLLSYLPRYQTLQNDLYSGSIPIWTDGFLGGFPIGFSEFGWFYPVTWLFLLIFPLPLAYYGEASVGLVIAAACTYWLGRSWGLSPLSAFLAGFIYGIGPFTIATSRFLNFADVFWVLPASILSIDMIIRGKTWYVLLLTFAGATTILAGHPHIGLLIAFGVMLYAAYSVTMLAVSHGYQAALRILLLLVGVMVAAAALGAVRIIPVLNLTSVSTRSDGMDLDLASVGSAHPLHLLLGYIYPAFDLPRIFGDSLRAEPLVYCGLVSLPLMLYAILRRRSRRVWFLMILLFVSWILAFGSHTPFFAFLHSLPPFSFFRVPGRFVFLSVFAIAMLSAIGLEAFRKGDLVFSGRVGWIATCYSGVLLFGLTVCSFLLNSDTPFIRDNLNRGIDRFLVGGIDAYSGYEVAWNGAFGIMRERLINAFTFSSFTPPYLMLVALFVGLIFFCVSRNIIPVTLGSFIVVALLVADLTLSPGHGITTVSSELASQPINTAALLSREEGNVRVFSYRALSDKWELSNAAGGRIGKAGRDLIELIFIREALTPNVPLIEGIGSIDGYENLMTLRQAEFLSFIGSERTTIRGFASDPISHEHEKAELLSQRLALLSRAGVTHIISGTDIGEYLGQEKASIEVVFPVELGVRQNVWIYEVPNSMPLARFSNDWVFDDGSLGSKEIFQRILDNPDAVYIASIPNFSTDNKMVSAGITYVDTEQDGYLFRVAGLDSPSILVLTTAATPGWSVFLDGNEADISLIDRFALGTVVPTGVNEVEFKFEPPGFSVGRNISLVAFGIVIAVSVALAWPPRAFSVVRVGVLMRRKR